jgi:hypothetical protein
MTRCKFKCESKTIFASGASVILNPVVSGSEENKTFYQYTPGGQLKLEIVNNEVAKQFEPGKEYYIDISPA